MLKVSHLKNRLSINLLNREIEGSVEAADVESGFRMCAVVGDSGL
jgi:hypothetical protein